jgi:hypothetical protein
MEAGKETKRVAGRPKLDYEIQRIHINVPRDIASEIIKEVKQKVKSWVSART